MGMKYIIAGSGIAGITAAKTIREHDPDADIVVYTAELQTGLYARRDLARHLAADKMALEHVYVERPEDLARLNIQVIYDPVIRVYARLGQVLVNHAIRQRYDRLLLASGVTPRLVEVPGHSLLGVHQAWNYEDFTFIENWMPDIMAAGAVVIGGGILGLDMAYALCQRGVPTTLVVREPRVGTPRLTPDEAQLAEEALRQHGVDIITGQTVAAYWSEDGKLLDGVQLSDGRRISARLAVCAVGVRPNTEFLEDSGLEVDDDTGGIVVNSQLRTHFEPVFAAGSCALVNGQIACTWAQAQEQGRIAGLNMVGHMTEYSITVPHHIWPLVLEAAASGGAH